MKKVIAFFSLLISTAALAQTPLFMPKNIQAAYTSGTRSLDGAPGKKYWQNEGRYAIQVRVSPPVKTITGSETIVYINHSPNPLSRLVVKLIQNIHQPGASRMGVAESDYLTSGIHIDRYTENGVERPFQKTSARTWTEVSLAKKLAPGDSITVTFNWHYEASKQSGREGSLDSTSFFLAYFYPRIAMFDDTHGWDRMDFVEAHEFYNEFNDYQVDVTVPANYLVWGTGMLQNASEVLQPAYLQKYNRSLVSDEVVNVVTQQDINAGNITAQKPANTWHFAATHVPDAAFCISNHYVWDAASVIVDKTTGRRSSCQAAYIDSSVNFHAQVEAIRHSLDFYSNKWPGVPYPFPKSTIIQGVADMEYPMMANDSPQDDAVFQRFVAEHEVGHSYFPFYMGINEHRYGFMDEGWTTAFENMIATDDMGKAAADEFFKQFRVAGWALSPSDETQVPIITPGNILGGQTLGHNEYGKAALAYLGLKDMLGEDLFRKGLHGFMQRWNGKHPLPWDMFYSFSNLTGKDLDWYWNNWFFTNSYMDVAVGKLDAATGNLTVKNIGGFAIPLNVQLTYADGGHDTIHFNAGIWQKNGSLATMKLPAKKKISSLVLDGGIYMDADETNNSWGVIAKKPALSSGDLEKYLGTYANPQVPIKITITKDGSKLIAEATGQPAIELSFASENKFTYAPAGIELTFDPAAKTVTLKQGGGSYVFTKE